MTFKPKEVIYSKPGDEPLMKIDSPVHYDKRRKAWIIKHEGYEDTVLYMDGRIKHDKKMKVIKS